MIQTILAEGSSSSSISNENSGCVLANARKEVGTKCTSNFVKTSELCTARVDDATAHQISAAKNSQPHEQPSAFSVTSTDGDNQREAVPMHVTRLGSISSCSDGAQTLTVSFKSQTLDECLASNSTDQLHTTMAKNVDSTASNRSINKTVTKSSDADCAVQPVESTTINQSFDTPNNFVDKTKTNEAEYSSDEFAVTESADDSRASEDLKRNNERIITVVHPIRQMHRGNDDTYGISESCQNISNLSQKPSSASPAFSGGVKSKSSSSKTVIDVSDSFSTSRLADNLFVDLQFTNNQRVISNNVVASTTQPQLKLKRKMDTNLKTEQIQSIDQSPSTIMERKTYIKKSTATGPPRIVATIKAPVQQRPFSKQPQSQATISSTTTTTTTTAVTPIATGTSDSDPSELDVAPSPLHRPKDEPEASTEHHGHYKLFYSGTEIELGLVSSPLSESSPDSNLQQSLASACESDNNLPHISNCSNAMKLNASLPSAIVHPLGLELNNSKHVTKCSVKAAADRAALIETLSGASSGVQATISSDERSSIDSGDNLTTASSSEGELDSKYNKPEYMLQIYRELGNHLKTMGLKPSKSEIKTKTRAKRLNVASRFLEAEEQHMNEPTGANCSPEPDENLSSLPFKKRRKLPVFTSTDPIQLIKEEEEECDSRPSESPASLQSMHGELEAPSAAEFAPPPPCQLPATTNIASIGTSINMNEDPQPTSVTLPSYPPTPMLSIANIVEYLPVRAYSTFKTPAPEMTPVRFNILPNIMAAASNAAVPSTSNATFNLISPAQPTTSQSIPSNQTNPMSATAAANSDKEYLTSMQAIASDTSSAKAAANGFNVAQYHPTFHSNSPYAATYSIQPAHTTNPNNLPPNCVQPNFDIQNMFNLRNYQMNTQHYHNLLQNSRINFQEKSILLNDYNSSSNSINEGGSGSGGQHQHHQHQQHQQQQLQQQQQQPLMLDTKTISTPNTTTTINSQPMAPRTKAARKMVTENVTVPAISANDKLSSISTQSNRVTRSSIRTSTRAQHISTEQKSPRRKTNRHR